MTCIIEKASDFRYEEKREFFTLEELMEFIEELGEAIVFEKYCCNTWKIIIYDDYLE